MHRFVCFFIFLFVLSCSAPRMYVGPLNSSTSSFNLLGEYKTPEGYNFDHTPKKVENYSPSKSFILSWPVRPVKVNQHFRPRSNPSHAGLDLGGKLNQLIRSSHEGLVIYVGNGFSGYGKMILVEYNKQWASLYAHLSKVSVEEGQIIQRGEIIGHMGNSGRSTGVHLHFELIKNKQPINPFLYL